jgi:hypothetical protein
MFCEHSVNLLKVVGHVGQRFPADGTLVAVFNMILVAAMMNAMTAWHENDHTRTRKHVLATNRTITLQRPFNAPMIILQAHRHANPTRIAMEVILAQALADPTQTAFIAMVNLFAGVVVPEVAVVAVVGGERGVAVGAGLAGWLDSLAVHAEHCRDGVAVVVLCGDKLRTLRQ